MDLSTYLPCPLTCSFFDLSKWLHSICFSTLESMSTIFNFSSFFLWTYIFIIFLFILPTKYINHLVLGLVFFFLHINCHFVNLATLIACIINPSSPWTGLSVLILPSLAHSLLYTFVRMIFMILIMAFSYLNTLNYMVFSSSLSLLNLYMWYFLFGEPHHPPFSYQANSYLSLRLRMKTSLFQGSHHCLQVWINVALVYA